MSKRIPFLLLLIIGATAIIYFFKSFVNQTILKCLKFFNIFHINTIIVQSCVNFKRYIENIEFHTWFSCWKIIFFKAFYLQQKSERNMSLCMVYWTVLYLHESFHWKHKFLKKLTTLLSIHAVYIQEYWKSTYKLLIVKWLGSIIFNMQNCSI